MKGTDGLRTSWKTRKRRLLDSGERCIRAAAIIIVITQRISNAVFGAEKDTVRYQETSFT